MGMKKFWQFRGCVICSFLLVFGASFFPVYAEIPQPPYHLSPQELDARLGVSAETPRPEDFLRVVYFYRNPGCATCQKMSRMVFDTLKRDFSPEIQTRKIVLRYLNLEDPKHARLVKTLNISSPSLFVVQVKAGKDVRILQLNRIWSLSGDAVRFQDYISRKIKEKLQ